MFPCASLSPTTRIKSETLLRFRISRCGYREPPIVRYVATINTR
jgi:hypothetical protein